MNRQAEIKQIWQEYAMFYRILGSMVLVGLGIGIGAMLFADDKSYVTNLFTEGISIAVTVFILDTINQYRAEQRRQSDMFRQLIRQIRSRINTEAIRAVEEMRDYGWLADGSLIDVDLSVSSLANSNLAFANLEYANLQAANLEGANLTAANLSHAYMVSADLSDANLQEARFIRSNLSFTDLKETECYHTQFQQADLTYAELQGATLIEANLKGADLFRANLEGVQLECTIVSHCFNERTILPDGSHFDVTKGIEQVARFIDPKHPDFWSPEHNGPDDLLTMPDDG